MVVEKFYFGGTEYTSAVTKARLYMKRGGGIDYGTLTLSRATTDTIGAISNGDAFQFRRTVTTNATVMFRGVIESIEIDDINYYKVKVVAETESYQRTEITDSWSSTNLEAILQDIDDGTGVTVDWQWTEIAIDSLALDKINKWDAIKQLSYMACITYWNDHKADTLVFHFPSGNDESPDLGTFVTGTHIIGVPKWETTNEHILNSVTVVYSGGSVQGQDATSIAAYGLHERTLNRLLLTDYDDAVTLANLVPTLYKDPIITAKFKIVKGICGEDGSGYENFPLGYHIDIDDNINYSDTKTSYHVDELTINYPEKYDEMVCSVRGVRGSLTDAYIRDQGARIELVERNVDQAVKKTSTPSFASMNVGGTEVVDASRYVYTPQLHVDYIIKRGHASGDNDLRLAQVTDGHRVWLRARSGGSSLTPTGICLSYYDNPCYFITALSGGLTVKKYTSFGYSSASTIFVIDASGNITTVGTVDGVDIAAHVADGEAHSKPPSPYEDASCDVSQVGAGTSNTEMNALSSGYVAIMPEKLSYAITITDSGAGYIDVQLDDDSWVNVFSSASTGSGSVYSYDVINVLGQRANYIKNIRSRAISASGNVTVNLDIWGWQT